MSPEDEIQENLKDSEDFENDSNSNPVASPTLVLGQPGTGKTLPGWAVLGQPGAGKTPMSLGNFTNIVNMPSSTKPGMLDPFAPSQESPRIDPDIFSQAIWWSDENENLTRLNTMGYHGLLELKDYLDLNVTDLFNGFLWGGTNDLKKSELARSILKIMKSNSAPTNDAIEWLEETPLYGRISELIVKHEENGEI